MKAILFDFDGTIANTIPAIREGVNNTMLRYGYPTHSDAEVLTFINHGPRELIRQAIPESARSAEQIDRVLADYNTEYGMSMTIPAKPMRAWRNCSTAFTAKATASACSPINRTSS